jgi:hypothetical protein
LAKDFVHREHLKGFSFLTGLLENLKIIKYGVEQKPV